jgi:hypothetical protein
MNIQLFDAVFKQDMKSRTLKDNDAVAGAISNAYHLSNLDGSYTVFGARFISSNEDALKSDIEKSLEQNYSTKEKSSELQQGWISMAKGFVDYWNTAKFSPMPTPLPGMTPGTGVSIKYAGNIKELAKELKIALSSGNADECSYLLSNILKNHQKNISGMYSGFLNNTPSEVPWVGIVSVGELVDIKRSDDGIRKVVPFGGYGFGIKEIAEFENKKCFEFFEWAQISSTDGKFVTNPFTDNIRYAVTSIPAREVIQSTIDTEYLHIHNHPPSPEPKTDEDNSFYQVHCAFSAEDIFRFMNQREYEMRVVDLVNVYILQPPPGGHTFYAPWELPELKKEIVETYETAYNEEYDRINNDVSLFQELYNKFISDLTIETKEFIFNRGGINPEYIQAESVIAHGESTEFAAKEVVRKYNLAYQKISRKQLHRLQ